MSALPSRFSVRSVAEEKQRGAQMAEQPSSALLHTLKKKSASEKCAVNLLREYDKEQEHTSPVEFSVE